MFNRKRLTLARKRRGLSGLELAQLSGITAVTISRLESGQTRSPDVETLNAIIKTLGYPESFFFNDEDPEELDADTVSFRSLKKMSAKERDAALCAGTLGLELYNWLETHFNLPEPDLLDLSNLSDPEASARLLREHWGLGDRPISNVLKLLEAKGVRALSLAENNENVDAYSFWRDNKPFIFLNTRKTAEHSIFDSAHELGHLIMHKHAGPRPTKSAESEANAFAAAFLMPANDIKASIPRRGITVNLVLNAKKRWRVSAMALTVRLNQLGFLSDWQYRSLCIDLAKKGYRKSETNGVERENSTLWQLVLTDLWQQKLTKQDIAKELGWPYDEIERLIFGLTVQAQSPINPTNNTQLKLV